MPIENDRFEIRENNAGKAEKSNVSEALLEDTRRPATANEQTDMRVELNVLPGDSAVLNRNYPGDLGGLVSSDFWKQSTNDRAKNTKLLDAEIPAGAKLINIGHQENIDVVGAFDPVKNRVEISNLDFNGRLAGVTIEGNIFKVDAPSGTYPDIPGQLYDGLEAKVSKVNSQSGKESTRAEIPYAAPPSELATVTESNASAEAGFEKMPELKNVSEFTRDMAEQRQTVRIAGIEHRYVEGKGYVTNGGAPNLLNPPASAMKNLGGNGPSGGYGNPGPFSFVQKSMVGEGESRRAADIVLPIPAYNPDPSTWGKEVNSRFPNAPEYRELPPGAKVEPVVYDTKAGAIPGTAAVLNKNYPEALGSLVNGDFFRKSTQERAHESGVDLSSPETANRLYRIDQSNIEVLGKFDQAKNQLTVDAHPFNGRLAGSTIEGGVSKSFTPDILPALRFSEHPLGGRAERAIEKGGKIVGALAVGTAVLGLMGKRSQASEMSLPSFEIKGK